MYAIRLHNDPFGHRGKTKRQVSAWRGWSLEDV
jgi:hypothetical protein